MNVEYLTLSTCVVGSGAAGYNAAIRLLQFGCEGVAMLTEGVNVGTSRNTGSDKQTYYKLGLGGDASDSVRKMAENLFAGGCTDGDNALVEAALSARSFLHLCELGVPFPTNRYGEYVGYKTDHDPYARATSVGPLTSKFMTEALEERARAMGLVVYDNRTVVEILTKDGEVVGLIAVSEKDGEKLLSVIHCRSIVYATGGPAGIYASSVYPLCHHGSSGVAFEAGVKGQNLTEWQYGLASTEPRWNVSGTYMQVLPRFVSVDDEGREYEFLSEYFTDPAECLSMVFLKGYQWPFDCRKVMNGSSIIDLLVYREEMMRGRRVYLDFRHNPYGKKELDYAALQSDAYEYLRKAGACFGTPIERLRHMNAPAVSLYAEKGVDLATEMLPISLCAQHNNGGLAVDAWWQTNLSGFFACGEVAGTHGITRPGGSALNAGQVGSLRAAQYIAARRSGLPTEDASEVLDEAVARHTAWIETMAKNPDNVEVLFDEATARMSRTGATLRRLPALERAVSETETVLASLDRVGGDMLRVYRLKDTLISQLVYLNAMAEHCRRGYGSRGSYLVCREDGELPSGLAEEFRFVMGSAIERTVVQECSYRNGRCEVTYRPVRPIPESDDFFENVWKTFRENGNID